MLQNKSASDVQRPKSITPSTEKSTKWTGGSKRLHTSGKNKTSLWTETRGPINSHTSMTNCSPSRLPAANGV